ncbi:sterile alpha motif domain-containing protein 15-like [Hydractinia symbiolongicarpus]|uniref:sterile alpha motif domain-containing protein 15-like n=1 Tax=Hydractinia symbiolongicarpus TaxID=13093 RepID=UPI00254FE249|nr:sterile alpha motif domain-containing protein 15-like [Hydractinia symbiolongicarpus]
MTDDVAPIPKKNLAPSFDKNGVPLILTWSIEDVGAWISEEVKLPEYEQCFVSNFIDGRKMINIDASSLPKLGVTDFEHIALISSKVRELLGMEKPFWNRPLWLTPHDPVPHFLKRKSHSGSNSDALTYEEHARYLKKFYEHKSD